MSDSMNEVLGNSEEELPNVPDIETTDHDDLHADFSADDKDANEQATVTDFDYNYKPYKDSQSSADDNKSSGWILILVAVAGSVFVILSMTGVIPVSFANRYLVYGVIIAVLVLFLVMGIVSMLNARKYESRAKGEKTLKESLIEWSSKNLSRDMIDSEVNDFDSLSDEDLYFARTKILTDKLNHQFINLDPQFLENLIDENLYDPIFNNDKNKTDSCR